MKQVVLCLLFASLTWPATAQQQPDPIGDALREGMGRALFDASVAKGQVAQCQGNLSAMKTQLDAEQAKSKDLQAKLDMAMKATVPKPAESEK